jgi:DNA-binding NarL/FixJ family response regulator
LAAAPATDPRLFTPPEGGKGIEGWGHRVSRQAPPRSGPARCYQSALEKDRVRRQHEAEVAPLEDRLQGLTPRGREVLGMVVSGMLNKQIASRIGTTENTIKVHRSRVMEKMQAQSLADLVRMVERLQISFPKAS